MEPKKFYHGTSTTYNIIDEISPATRSTNNKLHKFVKSAKVCITDDIDAAKYYANKAVEEKGGEPIIYAVLPDNFTLIKVSKTDYATASAKGIGVIKIE